MADHAQIGEPAPLDLQQQMTHTRTMNLNAEPVARWILLGHLGERVAIAEADFEHHRVIVTEQRH
jgi:hypothetical protein